MKTIKYLQEKLKDFTQEEALTKLNEEFGIKNSQFPEYGLVVLNYCQISSPKFHAITMECRSLVVDMTTFDLVSRSFDRFYNHGEHRIPHKVSNLVANEKMDGSLVTLFYNGEWLYRTRSMVMPENEVNGYKKTWKELIDVSIGGARQHEGMPMDCSAIFEVTGIENRVVVRYEESRTGTLLAVRCNKTGTYWDEEACDKLAMANCWNRPRRYVFSSLEDIQAAALMLPNLEEGYVMYYKGQPMQKIKNPAYVAAHHLRGEGLNPKRCLDLVILGELDEYIAVFPEDKDRLQNYIGLLETTLEHINGTYNQTFGITEQKEFALAVKDKAYAGCLFAMRGKGITANEAFDNLTTQAKYRLLGAYL